MIRKLSNRFCQFGDTGSFPERPKISRTKNKKMYFRQKSTEQTFVSLKWLRQGARDLITDLTKKSILVHFTKRLMENCEYGMCGVWVWCIWIVWCVWCVVGMVCIVCLACMVCMVRCAQWTWQSTNDRRKTQVIEFGVSWVCPSERFYSSKLNQ